MGSAVLAALLVVTASLAAALVLRRRRGLPLRACRKAAVVAPPPAPPVIDLPAPRAAAAPLVNVAAVVAEAIAGAALPADVAVERSRPRHAAFAAAEAPALREALRALFAAAAEAMPEGGALRVGLLRQGSQLVVEVSDSGAPLAESASLERARALAARCGARLERSAVPGHGNRSRVLLPAPAPPPLRVPAAHAALAPRARFV